MKQINKYHQEFETLRCCVIIPTYNNAGTIGNVINGILEYTKNIVIADDGSTDETQNIIKQYPDVQILTLPVNMGKGFALRKGFKAALEKGFRYAITIDSDGQHLPGDLPSFLKKIKETPDALIVGERNMKQDTVPAGSSFGHNFSNFWFKVETGINLPDTQSGYRLYPLEKISGFKFFTKRYEFEIEVLVRAAWSGVKIISVPIKVIYFPENQRVSHFRPYTDFLRVSGLNTVLVPMAVLYARPLMFYKNLRKTGLRNFLQKQFLDSEETTLVKSLSAAFGVFMGIAPIWGYQMALAIVLAVFLKLNKAIVLITAQISIPPLIPLILYYSYYTGGILLGGRGEVSGISGFAVWFQDNIIPVWILQKFSGIVQNLYQYLVGSLAFGFFMAIVTGAFTYMLLYYLKKLHNKTNMD